MPHPKSDGTDRPRSAVTLNPDNIPAELKALDRWILWRYKRIIKKDETHKWTKAPCSARTGIQIDATNFDNGTSFAEALAAFTDRQQTFDGLGFMLGEGIAGVDVDDCIAADGTLDERGQRMSQAYKKTYAEVSPSGNGFKVLLDIGQDPKLAAIGKNNGNTEIYGGNRYFAVTGALLPGHAQRVASLPGVFANTAAEMGVQPRTGPALAPVPSTKQALGIDMKAARELLDHLPFAWCDIYHDWVRAGMALHHEFGGSEEALALWDEWSQRNPDKYDEQACATRWTGFGRPGKDEVTLRTLVRDAQASGWRAPRTINEAIREFSPFDDQEDDNPLAPGDWWSKNSIGPMLTTVAPAKRWIWQGVLREGKVLVLAGSGGSSKSYLMLGACVQYALGNDWGPFRMPAGTEPGRVLLMYAEEDREDVHDRVQHLRHSFMLSDEQVAKVTQHLAVLPLRGQRIELAKLDAQTQEVLPTEQLSRLEARITQYGIKLVVLDPLALLHNLDENDNHAIAGMVTAIDAICVRTGCSIVIVHHFGKGGPMKAREINESNLRGASALASHARTVVVMHRLREDEAMEWGVPEADHARWVMWAVAKNNYGPSGARSWFQVNPDNGSISPASAELIYRDARSLREEALRARIDDEHNAMTAQEEHFARRAAQENVLMANRMRILLREAERTGKLPTMARAQEVLLMAGMEATPRRARGAIERIQFERLVDTDRTVSSQGHKWLEDREMLE